MAKFEPEPQFLLRLAFPFVVALRLNGYALHPPAADIDICELYGIETVLPNLYTGVRYHDGSSSPTSLYTRCFVTLGESRDPKHLEVMTN